jgi:hypothetical protein
MSPGTRKYGCANWVVAGGGPWSTEGDMGFSVGAVVLQCLEHPDMYVRPWDTWFQDKPGLRYGKVLSKKVWKGDLRAGRGYAFENPFGPLQEAAVVWVVRRDPFWETEVKKLLEEEGALLYAEKGAHGEAAFLVKASHSARIRESLSERAYWYALRSLREEDDPARLLSAVVMSTLFSTNPSRDPRKVALRIMVQEMLGEGAAAKRYLEYICGWYALDDLCCDYIRAMKYLFIEMKATQVRSETAKTGRDPEVVK